jgi:hypothetical protein
LVGAMVQFNCNEDHTKIHSLAAIGFRFHVAAPYHQNLSTFTYKAFAPTYDHTEHIVKTEIYGNRGVPIFRTWPSDQLLSETPPAVLADWKIKKVTWKARGGLDAFQFKSNTGMESMYCGYPDTTNWRPGGGSIQHEFGHSSERSKDKLGNTRKVKIWMNKEKTYITGLSFKDDEGKKDKQKSSTHTHGKEVVEVKFKPNQTLIGF